MDKETLSNYGWIVICVLVLAVMIALATPFGNYVKTGVESTRDGLIETSNKGMDVALLSTGTPNNNGGNEPSVPIIRNGVIPDGATYTPKGGTAITGNGTNTFPDTPATGDTYEEGDYIYKYNQYYSGSSWKSDTSQNGWGVRVKDVSKTSYGELLSEVAGKLVNNMFSTFSGCIKLTTAPVIPNSVTNMCRTFGDCAKLTTAPTIPNSVTNMGNTFIGCTSLATASAIPSGVTNMSGTFYNCTSLTTAPAIPSRVTNMSYTFQGCTSLAGTIEVNANPTYYGNCLKSTQITDITGSCSQTTKDRLMATK